jgi:hypothetical protein
MADIIYDFDYSEERQNEIFKKINGYVPLLENLITSFYPDLKFSIKSSLSHRVNLFAGYYEPKIEIIAENIEYTPFIKKYIISTTLNIKDTKSQINGLEFCESIYSYLPDVLYNTSFVIKNMQGEDVEWEFEEYVLRKEVEKRYEDYSLIGYSVNN